MSRPWFQIFSKMVKEEVVLRMPGHRIHKIILIQCQLETYYPSREKPIILQGRQIWFYYGLYILKYFIKQFGEKSNNYTFFFFRRIAMTIQVEQKYPYFFFFFLLLLWHYQGNLLFKILLIKIFCLTDHDFFPFCFFPPCLYLLTLL